MNNLLNQIKSNPVGGLAGGALGFYAAKKFMNVSRPSILILATVLGGAAGIFVQKNVMKKS